MKIPETRNKMLKLIQNLKSINISFVIYADTEFLFDQIQACDNNLTKSVS